MNARKPTHPGEILRRECLEPLSLSVTALARHLGVTRQAVSELLNEHAGVSADMALRLSRAFGTTPDLWVNLQKKHDLWAAKKKSCGWRSIRKLDRKAAA